MRHEAVSLVLVISQSDSKQVLAIRLIREDHHLMASVIDSWRMTSRKVIGI